MSPKHLRLAVAALAALGMMAAALAAAALTGSDSAAKAPQVAVPTDGELSAALATKLAAAQQFTPGLATSRPLDEAAGPSELNWFMHSYPATDIPLAQFLGARQDWKALQKQGLPGGLNANRGLWTRLGPSNALYPFNPFRDRSVYVANEYVATGRISHVAIDPSCGASRCRIWIANAGGGIWRTENALAATPTWKYLSSPFEHNNTAAIELDPNDPTGNTLWVGTGEPNICRSGCLAGVGLYKSTDGGNTWTGPIGGEYFNGRGIGSIEIKPGNSSIVYVGSGAQGSRGISNSCCTGVDRGGNIPGAPHFGLWKSSDGGQTFGLVSQGATALCTGNAPSEVFFNTTPCSPRGARRVKVDPVDPNVVYASFLARGIWRSTDNGATWERIMAPISDAANGATGAGVERAEFDVVALPGGNTRMYVGVGGGGTTTARFRRNDNVRSPAAATVAAGWIDLTSSTQNTPAYSSFGYCDPQCAYDNYVYVPKKADGSAWDPDIVYLSGDNEYNENNWVTGRSNGRAVLLSTNAGVHFTDMTEDDADDFHPNALHPDHHALVTNPSNWRQFFDVGDGGIVRSNGNFVDDSGDCTSPKGYTGARLAFCQLVLSRVPERLTPINKGINALHFYQLAYSPKNPSVLAGGTQDNGSWMTNGDRETWIETNVADGGFNGFDAALPNYSMTSYQTGAIQISETLVDQVDQTWVADTLAVIPPYAFEVVAFIAPAIFDPIYSKTMWHGREHVFRSTNGGINPAFPKAKVKEHCNSWTGDGDINESGAYEPFVDICDDWKPLGNPEPRGRLTYGPAALCPATPLGPPAVACPAPYPYGEDRSGGHVSFVERASDGQTLWAATSGGRIFISKNARTATPSAVVFNRIDTSSSVDPGRYPSGISIDPKNPNHAWITYSGYNAMTPSTPGHIFEVTYSPATNSATFTSLDGSGSGAFGDLPVADIARDPQTGNLFVGTDFGVAARISPSPDWIVAAPGLPAVNVPHLVIVPQRRVLYAATHGFGAWELKLP